MEDSSKTLHTRPTEAIISHPFYLKYKELGVESEICRWEDILATQYSNYQLTGTIPDVSTSVIDVEKSAARPPSLRLSATIK